MTTSEANGEQGTSDFVQSVRRTRNEWAAEQARQEAATMRETGTAGRSPVVPFFCECEGAHCHAVVWMSYEAYATLREAPFSRVVASGHDGATIAAAS